MNGMDVYVCELIARRWTTAVNVPVALRMLINTFENLRPCVQHSTVKVMNICKASWGKPERAVEYHMDE